MSELERNCPICNEKLGAADDACPRCGFKLIGATETFNAVPDVVEKHESTKPAPANRPVLRVVKGPYTGEEFVMGDGTFTVGRDPSCDLFLSNMTVSRHHATITIDGAKARIEDAGSLNGTWLDGHVIDSAPLATGAHVQIGTFEMVYENKAF